MAKLRIMECYTSLAGGNMPNERLDLPFDLYTRNKIISDLANLFRKNKKCLKILDIGGRSGHLNKFFQEDDDFYILDIRKSESNEKNYFVGDIIRAPFKDCIFDVVVSSDLFEHISHENRENSLSEMLRISKNFVILGAPFYSEKTAEVETKVNEFFLKLTGNGHPWLSEHLKNGLPSGKKLEDFLKNNGFDYLTTETNNISNWLLMQLFIFYSYKYGIPDENVSRVYRFYNENFLELGDTSNPAYRKIYLIGKKGTLPKVDFKFKSTTNLSKYHTLETLIFENIGLFTGSKDIHIRNLEMTIQESSKQITELNKTIQDKDAHIHNLESLNAENNRKLNDIYSSTTWQILKQYQRLIDILLPLTTKRRRVYDLGIISIRIVIKDGFGAFLYKLKEKLRGSTVNSSEIPLVETKLTPPHTPLSLVKSLCGKFTIPSNNLNEIRILTATYRRQNSDLILHILNVDGQALRKTTVKGYRIRDNDYTSFRFIPIKDSKGRNFFFKLISKGEPSAAVWFNESVTFPELTLSYNDEALKGSIGFQAFADIGIKNRYDLWILKNEPTAEKLEHYNKEIKGFEYQPKISIITPVYNPDVAWIEAAIESVINQVYENWELCIADASTKQDVRKCLEEFANKDTRIKVKFLKENKGISGNSNEALSLATGEFIALLDHDDEIAHFALYEVVKLLNQKPYLDFIYSDEDKLDKNGKRCDAFFKPDWSPDLLLSCMYTCHLGVYRKKVIDEIGGFRLGYEGSQDYDLVLRCMEFTDSNKIAHISKILYHWRKVPGSIASDPIAKNCVNIISAKTALNDTLVRKNIRGKVEDGKWLSSYRIRREIFGNPKVSIIIPTRDRVKILKNCIDSIKQKTTYENYELILVDNNSIETETIKYINELDCIKIKYKENFNFSKINNLAASHVNGDYIVFLNNDIEIITDDWIQSMLEHAQRKEVGAVGCKLLYPDGTIQHAGVILGLSPDPRNKVAGHIFIKSNNIDHGYFGLIDTIRNYSAVTAAAMMVRKSVFNEVGGFDENIAVSYNDVDLCLKIRKKGYLIVYTPFVELIHHESISRGNNLDDTEVHYMMTKWGDTLKDDPYYNPNLSLNKVNCEVDV